MTDEDSKDRGLTMIELIIGMGIGAVVASLAVYMVVNTFTTQDTVTSSTAVSTRAQTISDLIDQAVRNAAALQVVGAGTELDVEHSDGSCESFRVADARIERRTGSSAWADLSSYRVGSSDRVTFQVERIGSPTPAPYFATAAPSAVDYSFRLRLSAASGGGSVDMVSVAVPRTVLGSFSCS